jgi:hypothetical protein
MMLLHLISKFDREVAGNAIVLTPECTTQETKAELFIFLTLGQPIHAVSFFRYDAKLIVVAIHNERKKKKRSYRALKVGGHLPQPQKHCRTQSSTHL